MSLRKQRDIEGLGLVKDGWEGRNSGALRMNLGSQKMGGPYEAINLTVHV